MTKIHRTERDQALIAIGRARQARHPYVAIRPIAPPLSDTAKSLGRVIDPDVRREIAFDGALQDACAQWPGCCDWEVIGADQMTDGYLMQPRIFGEFAATSDATTSEAIGDGPTGF